MATLTGGVPLWGCRSLFIAHHGLRRSIIVPVMTVSLGESEPYYDLGSYQRPIDTPSPQAQVWFDRGMVWAYAFNHEEAIRCLAWIRGIAFGVVGV